MPTKQSHHFVFIVFGESIERGIFTRSNIKTLLDTPPKNLKPRLLPTTPSTRGFGLLWSLEMTEESALDRTSIKTTGLAMTPPDQSLRGGNASLPTKQSPLYSFNEESIEMGYFHPFELLRLPRP